MAVTFQKLTMEQLDEFIKLRIRQLREEGAQEYADLSPALLDYYTRHIPDGTFLSWVAMDNRIIATSGISIVGKSPYFGCPSGKIGLLSGMYTEKEYRRQGIARETLIKTNSTRSNAGTHGSEFVTLRFNQRVPRELLSRIVSEAREKGCGTVQITASDMGVKLYSSFGFEKNNNFMQYNTNS